VTQLRDVVYVVCCWFKAIRRYNATTHQRLADIDARDLKTLHDIVACELTCQLYVIDWARRVWQVSPDGVDTQRWWVLLETSKAYTLSVTSSRLLVTSFSDNQLIQFDAADLVRVRLPDYMDAHHAVESPTGTFIVTHRNTQLNQFQVNEVSTEGQVLRQFSGSLCWPQHIAVDRQGNIFVADNGNGRILLLDAQLALRRVIIDERQLGYSQPLRLCYTDQSGQLLIGFDDDGVAVFHMLRR